MKVQYEPVMLGVLALFLGNAFLEFRSSADFRLIS